MTNLEKLNMLKSLLDINDNTQDEKLSTYLNFAEREIVEWLYSLIGVPEDAKVPHEYETTQIMACVAGFNIRGAENQVTHSENGITRTFKYSDMVDYIRRHVISYGGIR